MCGTSNLLFKNEVFSQTQSYSNINGLFLYVVSGKNVNIADSNFENIEGITSGSIVYGMSGNLSITNSSFAHINSSANGSVLHLTGDSMYKISSFNFSFTTFGGYGSVVYSTATISSSHGVSHSRFEIGECSESRGIYIYDASSDAL